MTIQFDAVGPQIPQQTVDEFEATLPGPLSADYRAFLLAQNGGDPEPNWWPAERGEGSEVRTFLGLGEVEDYDSLVLFRERFDGRLPSHLLAIGHDQGGVPVCLILTGDDEGSVWVDDSKSEFDDAEGELVAGPLVRVCDSFTALLEGLEPEPELEEMERRYRAVDEANEVVQP